MWGGYSMAGGAGNTWLIFLKQYREEHKNDGFSITEMTKNAKLEYPDWLYSFDIDAYNRYMAKQGMPKAPPRRKKTRAAPAYEEEPQRYAPPPGVWIPPSQQMEEESQRYAPPPGVWIPPSQQMEEEPQRYAPPPDIQQHPGYTQYPIHTRQLIGPRQPYEEAPIPSQPYERAPIRGQPGHDYLPPGHYNIDLRVQRDRLRKDFEAIEDAERDEQYEQWRRHAEGVPDLSGHLKPLNLPGPWGQASVSWIADILRHAQSSAPAQEINPKTGEPFTAMERYKREAAQLDRRDEIRDMQKDYEIDQAYRLGITPEVLEQMEREYMAAYTEDLPRIQHEARVDLLKRASYPPRKSERVIRGYPEPQEQEEDLPDVFQPPTPPGPHVIQMPSAPRQQPVMSAYQNYHPTPAPGFFGWLMGRH